MSYAGNYIRYKGQDCIINRAEPVNTKVSIKRSTKSSKDLGAREACWEGLVLADSELISGETITIGTDTYLVQSTNIDYASGELALFTAKCNAVLDHKRLDETVDGNNNIIQNCTDLNLGVHSYGEVVTYRMMQEDPGLLEGTKYTFQVSKSLDVKLLDRLAYNGNNYQIVSMDDMGMSGVVRAQAAIDTRT